jgi:phospholipid/cholesterol/gamma-HCH transport system substrate-binding protein
MRLMFRERNPLTIGTLFLVWLVVVVLAALNVDGIANARGEKYHANVAEAGGLKAADPVTVNGVKVGRVTDVQLAEHGVDVTFTVTNGDVELGDETHAAIKVATVLGDKELALTSGGDGHQEPGSTIPMERTRAPYDVSAALADLTNESAELDTRQVSAALDTMSTTLAGTPEELSEALRGVQRLSRSLNSRDEQVLDLASHASKFADVLADRGTQMRRLVEDGNLLLAELQLRRAAIDGLLDQLEPFGRQLSGLVRDNEGEFGPALDNLNRVIKVLRANRGNLTAALQNLSNYATGLGEAVGSGRFFTAIVQNLLPGNLVPASPTTITGNWLQNLIDRFTQNGARR